MTCRAGSQQENRRSEDHHARLVAALVPASRLYGVAQGPAAGLRLRHVAGPVPPGRRTRTCGSRSQAWLYISDYGLGRLDGAWGIHDLGHSPSGRTTATPRRPSMWKARAAASSTPISAMRRTSGPSSTTYANGVRLVRMDMRHREEAGAAVQPDTQQQRRGRDDTGSEGWVYASREGIVTNPPSLATERIGPNQIQVTRSSDHHQNYLNAIRTGQKTICPVEVAVRARRSLSRSIFALPGAQAALGSGC